MASADQGPDAAKASQLLQDLGLTATEAAVYCTALQTCVNDPVSSYKLAQVMGRDPANVAKTLSALVRLQAMTIVQDKPRLYLPIEPTEFTGRVLSRLQDSSRQAVDLLRQFQVPEPTGVARSLAGVQQVFDRARALLAECRTQALVFGSKECLREIGAELEALAESGDCRVQVLSPLVMVTDKVEIAVFSPVSDIAKLTSHEFLQLVVDDQTWLTVVLDDDRAPGPQGWWGNAAEIATVMAASLTLAWQAGHSAPAETMPPPITVPPPAPVAKPEPAPVSEPPPEPEPEFEEGLTFLIRHNGDEDKKKGEQ